MRPRSGAPVYLGFLANDVSNNFCAGVHSHGCACAYVHAPACMQLMYARANSWTCLFMCLHPRLPRSSAETSGMHVLPSRCPCVRVRQCERRQCAALSTRARLDVSTQTTMLRHSCAYRQLTDPAMWVRTQACVRVHSHGWT